MCHQSLVDSEEIRREFGPQDSVPDDEAGFMQLGTSSSSSDVPNTTAAQQIAQIVNDSCILAFDPNAMHRQPRWMRALSASFAAEAQVEHVDEGPVAYVTTWYIDCAFSSTNEDSRVARIDFLANLWAQDFQHAWRDKLQPGKAVHLAWVNPRPRDNQFARTIGHVIVFQNPNEMFAPILIHFQFQALNLEGISHAVASIRHGIVPDDFASVVQLDRVCRGRRCTLHRGTPGKLWQDPFDAGECIKFVIPPPGSPSDFALHWGLGSVVPVFENVVEPLPPVISFLIQDHSAFVQSLHALWDQHASRGTTTSIERFLEVQTWYLDGVYVPLNDEMRPVVLSDDFTTWESDLRRVWHDMEDASLEVGFVLIQPAPPSSPLASIHVLLYQQIDIGHVGTIITTYDTAVPHSRPHSTAAVCADWVDKLHVIQRIGRTLDCIRAGVSCRVWHGRHEIENDMHPINHGTNLQLHIHRASLVSWDPDDEADTDIALLQIASPASTPVPASASDSTLLEPSEGFLALWQQKFATERSDSIRVSTWLVCPGQQLFFCRTPRTVRLHANLHTWVSSFAQTWELPTDFAQHLRIVLIEPSPIAMEVDLAAHVLLILHPRVDMIVSLVTIFDTAINQEHPFRTAIVTSENITPAEVIERTGYT